MCRPEFVDLFPCPQSEVFWIPPLHAVLMWRLHSRQLPRVVLDIVGGTSHIVPLTRLQPPLELYVFGLSVVRELVAAHLIRSFNHYSWSPLSPASCSRIDCLTSGSRNVRPAAAYPSMKQTADSHPSLRATCRRWTYCRISSSLKSSSRKARSSSARTGLAYSGSAVIKRGEYALTHGASACVAGGVPAITVSYTHLRAHETDSYLVCRLLLEKKK